MSEVNLTETLRVRVTPSDRALVEAAATALELTASEWMRQVIITAAEKQINVKVGAGAKVRTEVVKDEQDHALAPKPRFGY